MATRSGFILLCFIALYCCYMTACTSYGEFTRLRSAGINGGFEVVKQGLPVNWSSYTPNTALKGGCKIAVDTSQAREGKQSLKIKINDYSSANNQQYSGFEMQWMNKREGTYRISIWVLNQGTEFKVEAGGTEGIFCITREITDHCNSLRWEKYQLEVPVCKKGWLWMQVSVRSPGVIWFDDIQIERIS